MLWKRCRLTDLSFKVGDERWKKLRERALLDLFWFNDIVLGYGDLFPLKPETHLLFHKFMERKTGNGAIDSAPIQLVMMPRGCGKTTCGTRGQAIQLACANPNISILIANERQENANAFLSEIKAQFEHNDLLRALFPEVIPDFRNTTWAAEAATLKRERSRPEPTFLTIGVGGTVTGMHFDVILCDDLISRDAMENARAGAWGIMDKTNRWVNQLKPLLNPQATPFPWIRFIGTSWWKDDTYAYLEKAFTYEEARQGVRLSAKLPTGGTVSHDAWRAGDLAVFKMRAEENGKAVFPAIYDLDELARLRQLDPELYACNFLNDPVDAAVRTFQDAWLRYYTWVDQRVVSYRMDDGGTRHISTDDLSKILVCDPAFTATGQGARSAIVVVGTDLDTGKHLVLEALAERVEPGDLLNDILNTAATRKVKRVFIEAVAQQIGFINHVQSEAARRNLGISIETVKPGARAKDIRIESLSSHFRSGTVLVASNMLDFLREFSSFRPGSRLKDLLDALAYCAELWPNVSHPSAPGSDTRTKQRTELSDYYRKRGFPQQAQPQLLVDKDW